MVLACGMTFVILLGSIDLSTEGIVALSAVALSLLVKNLVGSQDFAFKLRRVKVSIKEIGETDFSAFE